MAGASLPHSHSQIIVMPVVSKLLGEELDGAKTYYGAEGRCVYCDIIADESVTGERLVYRNKGFMVITPYASRFPYETWILPTDHSSRYEFIYPTSITMLADAVCQTLKRMNAVLGNTPYNMMLHTSPFHSNHEEYYHWHFEILPVQGRAAGFEWGSGFHINSTPPELAAEHLRKAG
jgi:UDPglucose--hexose-1-phosphate uridylyltransferase